MSLNRFISDNIRDFADTLILARQEAEEDPNDTTVEKLSDTYLIQTLADIFFGMEAEIGLDVCCTF